MPLFGLTPVPGTLDAPAWTATTHRGPCYVVAPDTRRARLHAANHFTDATAVRTDSGMLPPSPWMQPALVAVAPAADPGGGRRRLADGTIMVPGGPGDGQGAIRVLRRGFGR